MSVKKPLIMTLIVCKDKEFKHRAVYFINNCGFPAEKIHVEDLKQGIFMMSQKPKLLNIVIDGSIFADPNAQLPEILPILKNPEARTILFLEKEVYENFSLKKPGNKALFICPLPFEKKDFNEAFHVSRGGHSGIFSIADDNAKKQEAQAASQQKAAQKPQEQKNVSAFEASAHLKETIEMINDMLKNPSDKDLISKIGQRFNGITGAFAYFGQKKGVKEIIRLSTIIDDLTRSFVEDETKTEFTKEHCNLLLDSAKCSFKILQLLRDDTEVNQEVLDSENKIFKRYDSDQSIKKRSQLSQNDVDAMIQAHLAS